MIATGHIRLPDGMSSDRRTFFIGDAHGNADLLERVLAWIAEQDPGGARVVFTGDLIDRGHENFRTVALAMAGVPGTERVILPGNHEIAFLKFMAGRNNAYRTWENMGGDSMIQETSWYDTAGTYQDLRREIRSRLPEGFEAMLLSGPTHLRCGSFLVLHAGVDPEAADPDDYLGTGLFGGDPATHWAMITDEFLDWRGGWERFGAGSVIHAHVPQPDLPWEDAFRTAMMTLWTHRRLNVDFGCGVADRLGGAEIDWDRIRFFGTT